MCTADATNDMQVSRSIINDVQNNYWDVVVNRQRYPPDDYEEIPWRTARGGTRDSWLEFRAYRIFQGQGAGAQAISEIRIRGWSRMIRPTFRANVNDLYPNYARAPGLMSANSETGYSAIRRLIIPFSANVPGPDRVSYTLSGIWREFCIPIPLAQVAKII